MSGDKYAQGMTKYNEADFDSSPELDSYQYGLFKHELAGKTLEIGAGAGRISKLAMENPNISEFVVSEPSDHFFKYLKTRIPSGPRRHVVKGESGALAAKYANHFDCIYSVDVMEHIEDDLEYLRIATACAPRRKMYRARSSDAVPVLKL